MTELAFNIAGWGITVGLAIVLAYIFHHNEEVQTPHDWAPKHRTYKNGILQ